ncbi:MAG: hypothetical protein MUF21_11610 [Gemmatimonadaceae bacterium]|jgi:hypothetical protein|nr:hypothetical protein [Gemmatimonadaceae bacterium]
MGTSILTTASTLLCPHGATATIAPGTPRVRIAGSPVATLADLGTIAGCPFQIPVGAGTKPQPCVTVRWLAPATRVRAGGQPVLLQSSTALCLSVEQIPAGPPNVVQSQPRVTGV